jgi:hypothetical protein
MVEWWAWILIVIGIAIFILGGFYASKKFKRGEYGWYRSGLEIALEGANAKAHCFLFTGERLPRISFRRYYSFCGRRWLNYRGSWKRIEDPNPDIMCPVCMDMVRRKTTTRFHILPWKWREDREAIIGGIGGGIGGTILLYLIQGKVAWAYLFTYPIFTFIFHLYLKRREAKKEEKVQRRE